MQQFPARGFPASSAVTGTVGGLRVKRHAMMLPCNARYGFRRAHGLQGGVTHGGMAAPVAFQIRLGTP